MPFITGNRYLSYTEQQNNAKLIYDYLISRGVTSQAICGMLGNMETESTMNPDLWESFQVGDESVGYGLVQWTPATKLISWSSDYKNGYTQLDRILWEKDNGVQWYATSEYDLTFSEFMNSTESPYYLAMAFIANYERPANPNQPNRGEQAQKWFEYLDGSAPFEFTPRFSTSSPTEMVGSKYYYSENPFYLSGFGLPNCTCYAWGRRYEITNEKPITSMGNADTWWDFAIANNQKTGQTPRLGAILCAYYTSEYSDIGGHVAIVEQINSDGTIITSNSAYGGEYFYTLNLSPDNGYKWSDYTVVQGFIYLDKEPVPPIPTKKKKMPLMYYLKRRVF